MIESVAPAGPEASEATTDENEDDIQFVSVSSNEIRVFPRIPNLCAVSRSVMMVPRLSIIQQLGVDVSQVLDPGEYGTG